MPLDPNYIPDQGLTDILEHENWTDDERGYERVAHMSVHEAFDTYLRHNGIIGYTTQIMLALDGLRVAHETEENDTNIP